MWQEGVLLRTAEAMDFIDEDDRAPAMAAEALGLGHYFLDFLDTGEHGAKGDKFGARALGNDARESGFAAAGRPPEQEGAEFVTLDLRAKRFTGPKQILLAEEFIQRLWPHAVGERTSGEWFCLRLDSAKKAHRNWMPAVAGSVARAVKIG